VSANPFRSPILPLQVEALYYNRALNKRWCSYLISDEPERAVLVRAHGSPLWSARGNFWLPPGPAIEVYPRNEWFNLFCAVDTGDGTWDKPGLHLWYINIAMPPVLRDGLFQYVDLDLDIGIDADFSYTIYDEEEFLQHCDLWRYPQDLCERARATLEGMVERVERRDPIFDDWREYMAAIPPSFLNSTEAARFPSTAKFAG